MHVNSMLTSDNPETLFVKFVVHCARAKFTKMGQFDRVSISPVHFSNVNNLNTLKILPSFWDNPFIYNNDVGKIYCEPF